MAAARLNVFPTRQNLQVRDTPQMSAAKARTTRRPAPGPAPCLARARGNARARRFYERLGFRALEVTAEGETGTGGGLYMGLAL